LNRVREQGCSEIQGYLFGRPLPISSVHELLKRPRRTLLDRPTH
jgi:EAL domain-containing protein (putative c-di-GMP-specific phosphodiesterase class I)